MKHHCVCVASTVSGGLGISPTVIASGPELGLAGMGIGMVAMHVSSGDPPSLSKWHGMGLGAHAPQWCVLNGRCDVGNKSLKAEA